MINWSWSSIEFFFFLIPQEFNRSAFDLRSSIKMKFLNRLFPPHLLLDLGLLENMSVCGSCWKEPFTCNIFIYLNQLPPEFTCAHFYVTYCLLMQLYLYSEGVWSRLNLPHLVSCSFTDSFINPDRGVLLCGYVEVGREACFPTHTRQRIILC